MINFRIVFIVFLKLYNTKSIVKFKCNAYLNTKITTWTWTWTVYTVHCTVHTLGCINFDFFSQIQNTFIPKVPHDLKRPKIFFKFFLPRPCVALASESVLTLKYHTGLEIKYFFLIIHKNLLSPWKNTRKI